MNVMTSDAAARPRSADGADAAAVAAARLAKVAELQRRRASAAGPAASAPSAHRAPARKSPALGSKIAATAIGVSTMLGLVAAMGMAAQKDSVTTVPVPAAPAQIVVMIHPGSANGSANSTAAAAPGVVQATPSQPIVLSAQPVIQQAPASQAPAAKTSGSR
ncbi:MAG: hypothetical protein Q7V88_14270 [Actinomycetota bacterium]|nr:hypothetical protein [Actinomycetota bacterium]